MLSSKKTYRKVGILALLKFFISFVYIVLTNLKEPLIVLAADSGAEVLPVLKGYLVFPASILFVLLFNWLNNYYKPTKIFFYFIIFFLCFFLFYIFILSPNAELLSPSKHATSLLNIYPSQKHWIAVYRHWVHALAFIFIELYGQVTIFMIFWGITNDLCSNDQARNFYHLIIAVGCLGGIVGTEVNIFLLKHSTEATYKSQAVFYLFWVAIVGILLVLCTYTYIYWKYYSHGESSSIKKRTKKQSTSLMTSLRYIFSNYHLLAIAVMVIACGLTINLVDVTYKANLKNLYNSKIAYQIFTARTTELGSFLAAFLSLFVSGRLMRSLGWKISSYIAPVVVTTTGIIFFVSSKFRLSLSFLDNYDINPLVFVVYMGVAQTLISKLAKYAFFDASKEIAYLGLEPDVRLKGKGAVDMVGSRAGKSFSGHVHTFLLWIAGTSSVLDLTHILIIVLIVIGLAWCWAVAYLGKSIDKHKIEKS
ncbi:MAG: Npt1/Npt2 family nucleotide transporter [Bacteroidota bacterium]